MGFHCKSAASCAVTKSEDMHSLASCCALCLAGLTGFECAGTDCQFAAGTRRYPNQSPRSLGERAKLAAPNKATTRGIAGLLPNLRGRTALAGEQPRQRIHFATKECRDRWPRPE